MRRPSIIATVVAVLLLAACSSTASTISTVPPPPPAQTTAPVTTTGLPPDRCPPLDTTSAGSVADPRLTEISGVAASRGQEGVLWVHNDSGDEPVLYALAADGALLATYRLGGADAVDWEDIAIGPGPDAGDYLYVGDIGDNAETRPDVVVYRVGEPPVPDVATGGVGTLDDVAPFTFRYPDGPQDAEALLVDPIGRDLYLVAKDLLGASRVFRAAAPIADGTVLTEVATLRLGIGGIATAADVSPAGDRVAIRTYAAVVVWSRAAGQDLADAFTGSPCVYPLRNEAQGEALGFSADGSALYTLSEGAGTAVQRHDFGG